MKPLSWDNLPIKNCAECGHPIPQRVRVGKTRYRTPTEYRKKKFCGRHCANTVIGKDRRGELKIKPPDREILNKMFQRLGNYNLMAKEIGVCDQTISKWLGKKKYLKNPKYYDSHY